MVEVYDKNGKAYSVKYAVDIKDWLDAGYTLEEPKGAKAQQKPKPKSLLPEKD